MSGLFTKMRSLNIHYPLIRGMISYSIIWPTCSMVQEYLDHGVTFDEADYARAARFGVFGSLFMAPVYYGWMKYTSRFFKTKTLKTAIIRAAVEQVSYAPLAMAYFFFGMSLLELKPIHVCWNEVKEKFWPTYKIGVIFWPTAQTLNFYFISEKNRIVFVSAASLIWTVYLAHMKAKEQKYLPLTDAHVLTASDALANSQMQLKTNTLLSTTAETAEKTKAKPEVTLGKAPKDQIITDHAAAGVQVVDSTSEKKTESESKPTKEILTTLTIENTEKPDNTSTILNKPVADDESKPKVENTTRPDIISPKGDVASIFIFNRTVIGEVESEYKPETAQLDPQNINVEPDMVTPKAPPKGETAPILLATRTGPGDDDKTKSNEVSMEEKAKDLPVTSGNDITIILNEASLVEMPLPDEELLKIIE